MNITDDLEDLFQTFTMVTQFKSCAKMCFAVNVFNVSEWRFKVIGILGLTCSTFQKKFAAWFSEKWIETKFNAS